MFGSNTKINSVSLIDILKNYEKTLPNIKSEPLRCELQVIISKLLLKNMSPNHIILNLVIFAYERQRDPYSNDPHLHEFYKILLGSFNLNSTFVALDRTYLRKSEFKTESEKLENSEVKKLFCFKLNRRLKIFSELKKEAQEITSIRSLVRSNAFEENQKNQPSYKIKY